MRALACMFGAIIGASLLVAAGIIAWALLVGVVFAGFGGAP